MNIRYDKNLNDKIRRNVTNFNAKIKYLEKQGYKNLPERTSVSELKRRYTKRSDLLQELRRMKSFRKSDLVKRVETKGGNRASKWQLDFIKANTEQAIEYFQREYERVKKRLGKYPGEKTYLDTITAKIDLLKRDINYMDQKDFRTTYQIVNEFTKVPSRLKSQYRGYLTEVEWIMRKLGYDEKEINKTFNQFSVLTPTQFLYAYDNNDIIARIYRLYHKDYTDTEARLTATEDEAKDLIDEFREQIKNIIKDAKANMD